VKVRLRCPDCNSSITVEFKTDDQFGNICELHVCRNCYEKFRIVLDLVRCLGCSGQGSLNQCGVAKRFYIDSKGKVINARDV
jgi:hypothetical protein